MTAILLGLLLGARHALDADHVVAVTAIVSRERSLRAATRVGALWGLGHTTTILLVGGAIILLRIAVPERVALVAELGVAVMLIVLGIRAALTASAAKPERAANSFVVGVVHGLAGSAALALLVLGAVSGTAHSIAYLAAFGIGTIAGMMAVTTAVGAPMLLASTRINAAGRYVRVAAGIACAAFGAFLAHDIGTSLLIPGG